MADDRVHSVYGTREEESAWADMWQVRAEKAEATIATQAAEIERLRAAIGCGHPNLRRTDITGTDVHGDGQ